MSFTLKDASVIALGALAGILGGMFTGNSGGTVQERAAAQSTANRVAAPSPLTAPTAGRIDPLETSGQLRAQAKPGIAPVAPPALPPNQSAQNVGESSAAEYQQHREAALHDWNQRLQQHASEPLDPKWSVSTGNAFATDLGQLAEVQSFRVVNTQCRTRTCSATVEWPDYDTATSKYAALLYQRTQANCAKEIVMPEPANRGTAYQATILYNCEGMLGM